MNELFGRLNGGGIVRVVVRKFGPGAIDGPAEADDVGTVIWHAAAPLRSDGSIPNPVTDECQGLER